MANGGSARTDRDPAVSLHFVVEIDDGIDLGKWSKCDGLSVEFEFHEYKEGGLNAYVHRIPTRAKYSNVKLSRPIDGVSTAPKQGDFKGGMTVMKWLADLQKHVKRHTAHITLVDPEGKDVAKWDLQGVYPVRWNGPSLDVGSNQLAIETLELSHDGFLGA